MEFTKDIKIYEIGAKIYPTDMSALHRKDGEYCDEDLVRNRLRNGHPFIVLSEPYEKSNMGLFEHEYYIDVKFENSDVVYCIFNTDCNVFTDYLEQMDFIDDCERCFALGY